MRRSNQPLRTAKAENILNGFGFIVTKNGGSHAYVKHEHLSIQPFAIVIPLQKQEDVFFKNLIIDACLQVIEIENTCTEEEDLTPVVAEDFRESTTPAFIPRDEFELVRGRNNPGLFLRHRKYPQIATTIGGTETQEWIDNKQVYLLDRVKMFGGALGQAVNHGFTRTDYPNGTIYLEHPEYGLERQLNAFAPRLENFTCISTVEDLVKRAQVLRSVQQGYLDNLIEIYGLEEVSPSGPAVKSFDVTHAFDRHKKTVIDLPVKEDEAAHFSDLMRLDRQAQEIIWGDLKKNMRRFYGADVTKPGDGCMLHLSHPYMDVKAECEMPMAPDFMAQWLSEYIGAQSAEPEALLQELQVFFKQRCDAARHLERFSGVIADGIQELVDQANAGTKALYGFKFKDRLIGKDQSVCITNCQHEEMQAKGIVLRRRDSSEQFVVFAPDIAKKIGEFISGALDRQRRFRLGLLHPQERVMPSLVPVLDRR